MLTQNETGNPGSQAHAAPMPHVVPPPVAAKPAPIGAEAPRPVTTQHRSAASVALHWALMAGGFLALVLIGQWVL